MKSLAARVALGMPLFVSLWGGLLIPVGAQEPTPAAPAEVRTEDILSPPAVWIEPLAPGEPGAGNIRSENAVECVDCVPCPGGPLRRYWHERAKPCLQATHWGYPEQFCERPFGTAVRAATLAQVENGWAAQMTLYRFDFITLNGEAGTKLNLRGRERLEKLVQLASLTFHPLVIEWDDTNPVINSSRRAHVIEHLQQVAPEIPEDRVIVARPMTRGMAGQEAVRVYDRWLLQVQSGATPSIGGATMSGGITSGAGVSAGASRPYDINRDN